MAAVMSMTVSAQRIDNTIKEARILTDKMVEELNLNNWQREKAYQMNLDYLNGINGRNDIHSQIWSYRNKQIMGILSSSQWQLFKPNSSAILSVRMRASLMVLSILCAETVILMTAAITIVIINLFITHVL